MIRLWIRLNSNKNTDWLRNWFSNILSGVYYPVMTIKMIQIIENSKNLQLAATFSIEGQQLLYCMLENNLPISPNIIINFPYNISIKEERLINLCISYLTLSANSELFVNLLEILEPEIVIDSLADSIELFFKKNIENSNCNNINSNNIINILLITLHYSILEHYNFLIWIKTLLESYFKNEISLIQTFTTSTEIYDSLPYEKKIELNFIGIIWCAIHIVFKNYESTKISKEMVLFLFIHLFNDCKRNEFQEAKFNQKANHFKETFLNKEFNWIYVPFFNLIKFADMFKISPELIISALVNTDDKIDLIEIFAETLEKFVDMEILNTMHGQAFLFGTSLNNNTKSIEKSSVDLNLFMKIALYLKIEFDEGETFIARIGKEKTIETIIKLISDNSGDSLCFYMKTL